MACFSMPDTHKKDSGEGQVHLYFVLFVGKKEYFNGDIALNETLSY